MTEKQTRAKRQHTKPTPVVRNAYQRKAVQVYQNPGVSMTEQHHARACDINTIMTKYLKTGVVDHINKYEPTYGDVSEADFKKSMDLVAAVKSEFQDLPAYVRAEIGDEATYLSLMQTDEGVSQLRSILAPGEKYEKDGSPLTGPQDPSDQNPAETPPETTGDEQKAVT